MGWGASIPLLVLKTQDDTVEPACIIQLTLEPVLWSLNFITKSQGMTNSSLQKVI